MYPLLNPQNGPQYAEMYFRLPVLKQFMIWVANTILPLTLNWADLVLATSPQLKEQLESIGCKRVEVCDALRLLPVPINYGPHPFSA